MEPIMGPISEREWGSINGVMYIAEESEFMAQLLHNNAFLPNDLTGIGDSSLRSHSDFWPGYESNYMNGDQGLSESSYFSLYMSSSNFYSFSQDHQSNYNGGSSSQQCYGLSDSHPVLASDESSISMDFCMMNVKKDGSFLVEGQEKTDGNAEESAGNVRPEAVLHPDQKDSHDHIKESKMPPPESIPEPGNSKKRSRRSRDIGKKKRTVQSEKKKKTGSNEEDSNPGICEESSGSFTSPEDDCTGSQELNGSASSGLSRKVATSPDHLNGKTRASRGSATDPQSLYARKRRERINERLRILQNIVPNGTKVDISTMLEEAVQYVKFLQLQIKLLSSDDLWMYAPIAYNGMDIGLDLKINLPKL